MNTNEYSRIWTNTAEYGRIRVSSLLVPVGTPEHAFASRLAHQQGEVGAEREAVPREHAACARPESNSERQNN